MKVLIIGDFCYPNYMGGSSKHVFDLITNFPSDEVDFHLITRKRSDGQYSADERGAQKVYDRIKDEGRITEVSTKHIFNPFTYLRHIRKADIVVLQHPVMGLFGGLWGRLYAKPIIYHYHGPLHLEYSMKTGKNGLHYKLLWLMQKVTVLLSNFVLTHSDYMKRVSIKEHKVPTSKCIYLPPYIKRHEIRKNLSYIKNNAKIKLLIPRRLTSRTGVIEFLNSFLTFPDDFRSRFDVFVTGKGELQSQVESLVAKDPDNLHYIGFVSYDDLWALYSKVDSVVVPTLDLEGFGYVILEGFSCGSSAIVSYTCGGGYEFIKHHLGDDYVFVVYSPESVKKALLAVQRNRYQREVFIHIADKYTTENMIKYYLDNILSPLYRNSFINS